MALPNRDAERLDHALDAQLQGREAPPSAPPSELLDTFDRLRVMNDQVTTDQTLQRELWRMMMTAAPISQSPIVRGSPANTPIRTHSIPFVSNETGTRRRGALRDIAFALIVVLGLVSGLVGFRQINQPNETPSMLAATATQVPSDAPVASDCASTPRRPGTVDALAGTAPTIPPALPRYGSDPVFDETAGTNVSDGEQLIQNSVAINGTVDGVNELMHQLVACRFFNGPSAGARNLDGKYYALFSDDFFRRELAGYKEAGRDINLVSSWMPLTTPTIVETRLYGSRLLVILQKANVNMTSYPVLMLAHDGFGWQVDEIGDATMPADWVPPVSSEIPTAPEVMSTPRLDISLYDAVAPQQDDSGAYSCPEQRGGTPVPCGQAFALLGPYLYNELPAGTDFTLSFSNIGSESRRVESVDLGIDIEIAAGSSATFIVNAEAGEYQFSIYTGDSSDPSSTGSFTFAPADQQRSVG